MSTSTDLQLSLADVARLAGVQRPVVSMWRRRERPESPFPEPVATVKGQERFDAAQIAAYLAATGRGKNDEAHADAAAYADTPTGADEQATLDALTALLCLATITGESLGDHTEQELKSLAQQTDPGDQFLRRELTAASDLPRLAAHADALTDAAYTSRAAFEGLLKRHQPTALPGHAATTLRPTAIDLVSRIARALALDADMDLPVFVDPSDSSGDLLLALAATEPITAATAPLDTPTARLTRRRLRAHDVHRVDATAGIAAREVVYLLHLPSAGDPAMTDVDVLEAIDDLVLEMTDAQRAVILGPASALVDRPADGEVDLARDALLRTDRVRFAVRLPAGLLPRAPRQELALWVIGPAHPDIPRDERWTAIADLADVPLTRVVIEDVVSDAVAALTPHDQFAGASADPDRQVHGRQLRYARRVRTATILPGRTALVARRGNPGQPPAAPAAAVDGMLRDLGLAGVTVAAAHDQAVPAAMSFGEALGSGALRMVSGNRLDLADVHVGVDVEGGRPVVGPPELTGESQPGDRRIALVEFATGYPAGRLTEPGDVIFCTAPRIAAYVDRAGGSVVQFPARILRITTDGSENLLPEVVAEAITQHAGDASKDWRTWLIRPIPTLQTHALADAFATIEHEREIARRRLAGLDDLAAALTSGVTAGTVRLSNTRPPTTDEGSH